ncbi:MAG: hypothetical protein DWQ05_05980 [Calditrichaeota bacterium]|nr:MAG: hypothetical protein DWQ05_05980 [Calditrichota bacterium]
MLDSEQIINIIPNIHLFEDDTTKSLSVYSKFFLKNKKTRDYSHSMTYFFQSSRNFWAYYLPPGKANLITITTKYPNGRPPFVIVYPMGKSTKILAQNCRNLALKLQKHSGEKVILKKIPIKFVNEFHSAGFTEYLDNDGWSVSYKYDDDDYPEFIINIERYLSGRNNISRIPVPYATKTSNLRGHARRFINWLDKEDCSININSYNPKKDYTDVKEMISTWAKFRKLRHREEEIGDLLDSHECFLPNVDNINSGRSYKFNYTTTKLSKSIVMRLARKGESKVIAFGFIDRISDTTAGIYSEIALHQRAESQHLTWDTIHQTGVPGCSEVLTLIMLEIAFKSGYLFANFGGSESRTLFMNRKYKFPDYEKNKMTHLVLYYPPPETL